MKKTLLISTGVVLSTGVILLFGLKYFYKSPPATNIDTPTESGPTISVKDSAGKVIETKNFIDNPEVVKDSLNPGYYYIGYHFGDSLIESSATNSPPYVIGYIAKTQYFNISILKSPIMETRRLAEVYLMKQLGISKDQMCRLKHAVSAPNRVDRFYAGLNLGFSFCKNGLSEARDTNFRTIFENEGGVISAPVCAEGQTVACISLGDVNPDLLSALLTIQSDCKKSDQACQVVVSNGSESRPNEIPGGANPHEDGEAIDIRASGTSDTYMRSLLGISKTATIPANTLVKYSAILSDGSRIWSYRIDDNHWHIQLVR